MWIYSIVYKSKERFQDRTVRHSTNISVNILQIKGQARSDPIRTARALSAAVNVQDDNGVLFGNWGKELSDYSGGNHPLKWVGSLDILQKYYQKKKPVKYAQCWVYAGVLTTSKYHKEKHNSCDLFNYQYVGMNLWLTG